MRLIRALVNWIIYLSVPLWMYPVMIFRMFLTLVTKNDIEEYNELTGKIWFDWSWLRK